MDEQSGQADLQALFEMRRRMVAAFEDIAMGVEALASQLVNQSEDGASAGSGPQEPGDLGEVARLREALEEERTANAQLEERVRVLHARGEGRAEAAEADLSQARERAAAAAAAESTRAAELDAVLSELIPLLEEAV